MATAQSARPANLLTQDRSNVTGANRRTLKAIFQHPISHSLEWDHIVSLVEKLGEVGEKANSQFAFRIGEHRHLMHRPHTKDLTASEVMELRQFFVEAGLSPGISSQPAKHPFPDAPSLLIVIDHHEAKIFQVDLMSEDVTRHVIKPYDPHHFLHHLAHKDQSRERGRRAPEDQAFYGQIAAAVALGGRIVVVGHGTGKSDAAHHLVEYLRLHHPDTYQRVVREVVVDLSSVTTLQLLEVATRALVG